MPARSAAGCPAGRCGQCGQAHCVPLTAVAGRFPSRTLRFPAARSGRAASDSCSPFERGRARALVLRLPAVFPETIGPPAGTRLPALTGEAAVFRRCWCCGGCSRLCKTLRNRVAELPRRAPAARFRISSMTPLGRGLLPAPRSVAARLAGCATKATVKRSWIAGTVRVEIQRTTGRGVIPRRSNRTVTAMTLSCAATVAVDRCQARERHVSQERRHLSMLWSGRTAKRLH